MLYAVEFILLDQVCIYELLINPFEINGIFHKATYNKFRMVHSILRGVTGSNFQYTIAFLSLKLNFVTANSADLDKMPHCVAFHLGLCCLPKYSFRGF